MVAQTLCMRVQLYLCITVLRVWWYLCLAWFTVKVQQVLLSSGSARLATWNRDGATRASPLTGSCVDGPGCRCTASAGCKRCRLRPLRSGARGDLKWSCAPACCSYSRLERHTTIQQIHEEFFSKTL